MKKDDVQITVGVISNEFNFHAEGDNELAFQVMMLGLATLLENVKNDDAPVTGNRKSGIGGVSQGCYVFAKTF